MNERDRDEILIVDALGPVYSDKVKRILTTDNGLYYSKSGAWVLIASGGATLGGTNQQIQFNDSGVFGGNANLLFDKAAGKITMQSGVVSSSNPNILEFKDSTGTLIGQVRSTIVGAEMTVLGSFPKFKFINAAGTILLNAIQSNESTSQITFGAPGGFSVTDTADASGTKLLDVRGDGPCSVGFGSNFLGMLTVVGRYTADPVIVARGPASHTGALQEWRQTGNVIVAAVNANGGAVFNENGLDTDCRIEGDTDVNLLVTDASQDSVGIGVAAPDATAKLQIDSTTKGFLPPRMTTVQRDAIGTPAAGLTVYNTTTNKLNVFTTAWEAVTSA